MHETLAVATAFPTVVFTVLLSLAVLYWLFVVVGAVDLDGFDGAAKGALEGAAKGALEGAAKGALGGGHGAEVGHGDLGDVDAPVADGVEGDGAADGRGFLAGIVESLRLRSVPATVTVSFFAAFGWLSSGLVALSFGPLGVLPGVGVLFGSTIVSLLLTSLAIRPLAPAFRVKRAQTQQGLEGKIAIVSTGEVTPKFGQATLDDGGAGLILQIRTDGQTKLVRGDRVVLLSCDARDGSFLVEKLPSHDDMMLGLEERARVASSAEPASDEAKGEAEPDEAAANGERTSGVRRTSRS
jgi:hypothetical protein